MGLRRLRLGLAMLTYQDWLLFCFVLGVLGGTAAALAFGGPVGQGCGRNHEDTFMQLLQHCGHGPCWRESILGICIRVLSLFSPVCGRI